VYMCICDQDSVQRDGSFVRSFVDTARRHGSVRSVVRWLAGRLTSDEVITVAPLRQSSSSAAAAVAAAE